VRYKTAAAFRVALETRLLTQSRQEGLPLVRLRKAVAFDRLLARLVADQPDRWVLKGGYALQLRLENAKDVRPRTTRDVNLQTLVPRERVRDALIRAARVDLGDWVQFEVSELTAPRDDEQALEQGALRSQVTMFLDGRRFEAFNVDVNLHDPLLERADLLALPPLLEFAGITPIKVPCYPLAQHIAEKVHAYTREHVSGPNTRVKDLVDLLLIAELGQALSGTELRRALEATFAERGSALPSQLPDPPTAWERPYQVLAREARLRHTLLHEAMVAARLFIDPVLGLQNGGRWDHEQWRWR